MRQIDPNLVLIKSEVWIGEEQKAVQQKQIEIPKFAALESKPLLVPQIPHTYIHTNIVYPDENQYSCDDEDVAAEADSLMIQQLDIRRNLNNSRNYSCQYELLNSLDYSSEYYDEKVERLGRPLLRVFMRGQENDYRMNIAFRPSRAYKQKRQKRLNLQLPEFQVARQIIHTENRIALHLFSQIKQRELLKLKLIKQEEAEFTSTFSNCVDLFNQLKDLRVVLKEDELTEVKDNRTKIFEQCADEECAYQFQTNQISYQVIDYMDDQYSQIKERCIHWPKYPTLLSNWNVDHYTNLGIHQKRQQIISTTLERTLFVMDRTKKNKKKVKLMLVDRNRGSVFDGVRAEYEHFYAHYQKSQQKTENQIEQCRKDVQKVKQELAKKEQLLKIQQKKEEQKKSLKIKLKLNQIVEEPKIVKTIKIKHSDNLKFVFVKDDSTRISLKQENFQIVLK